MKLLKMAKICIHDVTQSTMPLNSTKKLDINVEDERVVVLIVTW